MALIVKKFGGSSVANAQRVFNVANRIIEDYKKGNDIIVVVSAQGDTTDDLIDTLEWHDMIKADESFVFLFFLLSYIYFPCFVTLRTQTAPNPASSQPANVISAIPITVGTNTPATLSANRAMGALDPPASSTNRTICARVVSLPTLVARHFR